MAMASANVHEALEIKEDDVTCPVCFEYYEQDGTHQPKLLSCVHTICLQCVKKLDQAKCPYCAAWLRPPQGLPDRFDTNASVLELLKRYQEQQRRLVAIVSETANGGQAALDPRMPVCAKCHRMLPCTRLDDHAGSSPDPVVAQCRQCLEVFCQMCFDVHHQQSACFGSRILPVGDDDSGPPEQFVNYGPSLYQEFVGKSPALDEEFMDILATERLNALKREIDNMNTMSALGGRGEEAAQQVAQKRDKLLNVMADFRELFSIVEPLVLSLSQYKIEAICCPNGEREKFLRALLSPLQDVNPSRLIENGAGQEQQQQPGGDADRKLYYKRLGEFIKVNLETLFKGRCWFVIVGNLSMVSICVPDDMQLARFYAWIYVNEALGIIAFDAPSSIALEHLPPVLLKNQQNYEYLDRVLQTFAKRNEGNDDAAEAIRRGMESEFERTLWTAVVAPSDAFALVPQPRGIWAIYPSGPVRAVHRNTRYLWQAFLVDCVAPPKMNMQSVVEVKREAAQHGGSNDDYDLIKFD